MLQACRLLGVLWILPLLVLYWLKSQGELIIKRWTVEPVALAGLPPHTGFLSNLGVVLWFSTASVLIFLSFRSVSLRRACLIPGVFSLWLGLDDGMMLHEELLPHSLGISSSVVQPALYALYAASLGLTLRTLRPWLREPAFLVLLAASFCLGASVSLDMIRESHWLSPRSRLVIDEGFAIWLEEGLKLLGIVAWWGYWLGFAGRRCRELE